jgi:predicted aspartyl protease
MPSKIHLLKACKKRGGRIALSCASGFPGGLAQLPTVKVRVGGEVLRGLVDTGCSRTVLSRRWASSTMPLTPAQKITMMDGSTVACVLSCGVDAVVDGTTVSLDCLVVDVLPGYQILLGMDAVKALGGVRVSGSGAVAFGASTQYVAAAKIVEPAIAMEDEDCAIQFVNGTWQVRWKWKDGIAEPKLQNGVAQYKVPQQAQEAFDYAVDTWFARGAVDGSSPTKVRLRGCCH